MFRCSSAPARTRPRPGRHRTSERKTVSLSSTPHDTPAASAAIRRPNCVRAPVDRRHPGVLSAGLRQRCTPVKHSPVYFFRRLHSFVSESDGASRLPTAPLRSHHITSLTHLLTSLTHLLASIGCRLIEHYSMALHRDTIDGLRSPPNNGLDKGPHPRT